MNSEVKVYVIGSSRGYARPIYNKRMVDNIADADIVVLTGGEDVDPRTYNKKNVNNVSWGNRHRDIYEIQEYSKVRKDQLVMGTCRGAQLLTVINGGNLIQDVDNHGLWGTHDMIDRAGNRFEITSLHHQMCYPFDINPDFYDLLMVSAPSRGSHYIGDGIDISKIKEFGEPELIAFKNPSHPVSVAIQGHPEMMDEGHLTVKMFNEVLRRYLDYAKSRK